MAGDLNRGEIWLHTFSKPDKRRPVVVLSRQSVIPLLRTVIVAPITSTARGVPSEVPVGIDEGLKNDSVVNLDHIQTVDRKHLRYFVGTLDDRKMAAVCRALALATGCLSS
ncbi:MAG: type II toxin-antitoxin system PemK/MazF family toxin [Acidobacteriota bacterium]